MNSHTHTVHCNFWTLAPNFKGCGPQLAALPASQLASTFYVAGSLPANLMFLCYQIWPIYLQSFLRNAGRGYLNHCLLVIFGNVCLFQNIGTLLQHPITTERYPGNGTLYPFGDSSFSYVLFSTFRSAHPTFGMSIFFQTRRWIRLNPGSHQCVQQIAQRILSASRISCNGQLEL